MARFKGLDNGICEFSKVILHRAWLSLRDAVAQWASAIRHTVRVAAIIVGMIVLAGCETSQIKGLCPSYVHYSTSDDQTVLTELHAAEAAGQSMPITHRYLRDYGKQRAALRVICTGS